ncbi:uncharacterized protein LOC110036903 isoform X1 [Phalaenopsis equestris]|uniref:uncharacterized protein LOC110036903 isoform X1 n=1 Tax=Phalaenopsis equestris TaxID=78828 RepID=UPI0009E1913C|nr:uncharacterized protein LOC110036903 isoform X1 [Phalaenopsis equestris]
MVRASMALHLKDAGAISKALLDILVCPISKQPLRYCQETQSIICNAIGVSFPASCVELTCLSMDQAILGCHQCNDYEGRCLERELNLFGS